ncbi:hypothetical protein MLD38_023065 [Melastoma candidum]|uniref:Uncharacterized protein n=1 Tax=Melastoma candidum TaxID=119954 RepID=A0ACB9QMI8_9MYRT|nr:hypothetical protein MLD38_023065 [Melastoma candidum]
MRANGDSKSLSTLPPTLDDDGFPSIGRPQVNDAGEETFASSFYRGGTDWSHLVSTEDGPGNGAVADRDSEKRLRQTSLFRIWGLKRKEADDPEGCASSSFSLSPKRTKTSSDPALLTRAGDRPRACPFYKKMPGTPFTVDAFRYGRVEGCTAYFLTHFHADHYGGLSKKWSHGPIYCTPLTTRLVKMCLYVDPLLIHSLELNEEYVIEGVRVTLLEANHCPGAALILFCLQNGQHYLHTGDFRASRSMQSHPLLLNNQVDVLYLDTTYCNPRYRFPAKEDVLNYVVKITRNFLKRHPKTLVVVGAYSIGKECVYLTISKALGVKIHANSSRRRILNSFNWPELSDSVTSNPKETFLHVLPISSLRLENLSKYLKENKDRYTEVLAFRPTGWTYSEKIGVHLDLIKPNSKGNVTIYGVPYSEHSSYTELREFVQFLRPKKIIPTVNVSNASGREKMQSYFREWLRDT